MTEIEQLKCPNCGGLLSVPPGSTRVPATTAGPTWRWTSISRRQCSTPCSSRRTPGTKTGCDERKQLYAQYMAQYAELRDIDTTLLQRQLIQQTSVVKFQLKELYRRRNEVVQALATPGERNRRQRPASSTPRCRPPIARACSCAQTAPVQSPAPALAIVLLIIAVFLGYMLTVGRANGIGLAGAFGLGDNGNDLAGQGAPDPTGTALGSSPPADTGYFYRRKPRTPSRFSTGLSPTWAGSARWGSP